ncbi:hypothetical protein N0V90_000962 [Kalmusia sp. IMI 367209]|nr:hypothetical protein N0V90_000962 [Kalmusia sp. IMI 367209]
MSSLYLRYDRLILCKCDFTSIRDLIDVNSYIKDLFLLYPQTFLRDMVRELPSSVANLLCLSYIIYSVPYAYIDAPRIIEWLEEMNSTEDFLARNSWILDQTYGLQVLWELADIMNEIDEAVKLYADSVLAIMDTVSRPNARHTTIGLSSTEYARIASAFLLLKTYMQYRNVGGDASTFMDTLQFWQAEQIVTVNKFLERVDRCSRTSGSALYYLVDHKYRSDVHLRRVSLYVKKYLRSGPRPLPSLYLHLRRGDMSQWPFHTYATRPRFSMLAGHDGVEVPPTANSDDVSMSKDSSPSHGWNFLQSLTGDKEVSDRVYHHIFLDLGILFWDQDRLRQMYMGSTSTFQTLVERVEEALYRGQVSMYNNMYVDDVGEFDCFSVPGPHVSQQHIVEWTRCPVQCTFGEWMMRDSFM